MLSLVSTKVSRLLGCCLLSVVAGCGESTQVIEGRTSVSGRVTFDGKPLPAGMIGFVGTEQPASTAVKIRDGAYFTDRAPIGKNKVYLDTSSIQLGNPAAYVPIPAKYTDSTKSGLSAEIKPGENENVDFALEK